MKESTNGKLGVFLLFSSCCPLKPSEAETDVSLTCRGWHVWPLAIFSLLGILHWDSLVTLSKYILLYLNLRKKKSYFVIILLTVKLRSFDVFFFFEKIGKLLRVTYLR